MKFEIEVFLPSQKTMLENIGLNDGGRVQKVIDVSFMHYMKLKMPQDSGTMINNTRSPKPGLITIETPYAHYMNEGIKYVDPINGKGAFHDPISGRFWSRPGVKKISSGEPLKYHGSPDRGSHFVERTATNNFNDILNEAQKEVNKS